MTSSYLENESRGPICLGQKRLLVGSAQTPGSFEHYHIVKKLLSLTELYTRYPLRWRSQDHVTKFVNSRPFKLDPSNIAQNLTHTSIKNCIGRRPDHATKFATSHPLNYTRYPVSCGSVV